MNDKTLCSTRILAETIKDIELGFPEHERTGLLEHANNVLEWLDSED